MTLVQVLLVFLTAVFVLGVPAAHPVQFVATMVLASLVFLSTVFALLRVFGEAGKLLAVLLLTLQLAAGGGVMPIELTGDFFRAVHSWLPCTWIVMALRVSLFDALLGDWLYPFGVAALSGCAALAVASVAGRWKVVQDGDYVLGMET